MCFSGQEHSRRRGCQVRDGRRGGTAGGGREPEADQGGAPRAEQGVVLDCGSEGNIRAAVQGEETVLPRLRGISLREEPERGLSENGIDSRRQVSRGFRVRGKFLKDETEQSQYYLGWQLPCSFGNCWTEGAREGGYVKQDGSCYRSWNKEKRVPLSRQGLRIGS